MEEDKRRYVIRTLEQHLQEWKGEKPDITWCNSYEDMRRHLRKLKLYRFCPEYFAAMLQLVLKRAGEGLKVPDYILAEIRGYFNKGKAVKHDLQVAEAYAQLDLRQLLGERHDAIAASLFEMFKLWIEHPQKGKLVNSLITKLELPDAALNWMMARSVDNEAILNKILWYPFASENIAHWAENCALKDGAMLHRLPEIIGRILDVNPDYFLPVFILHDSMNQIPFFWQFLREFYEEYAKDALITNRALNQKRVSKVSAVDENGNLSLADDTIAWLDESGQLHPAFNYRISWLMGLDKLGMRFRLEPNIHHIWYATFLHYYLPPNGEWHEFVIKNGWFDQEAFPEQTHSSISNFYALFPHIDIESTIEEWKKKDQAIRNNCFLWGIHRSRLSNEKKAELYQRYYDTEIDFPFHYVVIKEKNVEMAKWLVGRLKRKKRR